MLVIILPVGIYEFLFGSERTEEFLKKMNININLLTLETISIVLIFVALGTYMIRRLIM